MARTARWVAVGVVAAIALGSVAMAGGRRLETSLSGAEEVDNGNVVGDADGTGTASLTLNPGREEVCYELTWQNVDGTVQNAHIHEAPAGQNGGVVVALFLNQSFPGTGSASDCVEGARDVLRRILQDPSGFYVNVHDTVRPLGAIRGQLER